MVDVRPTPETKVYNRTEAATVLDVGLTTLRTWVRKGYLADKKYWTLPELHQAAASVPPRRNGSSRAKKRDAVTAELVDEPKTSPPEEPRAEAPSTPAEPRVEAAPAAAPKRKKRAAPSLELPKQKTPPPAPSPPEPPAHVTPSSGAGGDHSPGDDDFFGGW